MQVYELGDAAASSSALVVAGGPVAAAEDIDDASASSRTFPGGALKAVAYCVGLLFIVLAGA